MQPFFSFPARQVRPLVQGTGRLSLVLLLGGLICLSGCSAKKPKTLVTGKVTVGDKNVQGSVVFVGDDGKEHPGPITDGTYTLRNVPKGQYKVAVKGMGAPTGGTPGGTAPPPGGGVPSIPKDAGKDALDITTKMMKGGVPPPAKYTDVKTSGLTFEVTGGEQTYDLELKP